MCCTSHSVIQEFVLLFKIQLHLQPELVAQESQEEEFGYLWWLPTALAEKLIQADSYSQDAIAFSF